MRTRRQIHITPKTPRWWVKKRTNKATAAKAIPTPEISQPTTEENKETSAPTETPISPPTETPISPPTETPILTTSPVPTQQIPQTHYSPTQNPPSQPQANEEASGKTKKSTNEDLEELYTNIKSNPKYSAKIADFLRTYKLHSVNKRISKKIFPRRRVIARCPFDVWMADLIEYPAIKWYNKNNTFILLVIDVFTKVIYAEPMKRKLGENTAEAMEKILAKVESAPVMLVTDRGREFYNSAFRNVMFSNGINHFSTPTLTKFKASVAERAIRTIKTRIGRYMQDTKSNTWIDVLDDIVEGYNKTPHSSHGLPPLDVINHNRKEVYKRLYPKTLLKVDCRLKVGDKVRKIREKQDFEKGYTPNWSEEIFTIATVRQKNTVCWYTLADSSGDVLTGIWYYYQLNLVTKNAD